MAAFSIDENSLLHSMPVRNPKKSPNRDAIGGAETLFKLAPERMFFCAISFRFTKGSHRGQDTTDQGDRTWVEIPWYYELSRATKF